LRYTYTLTSIHVHTFARKRARARIHVCAKFERISHSLQGSASCRNVLKFRHSRLSPHGS